MARSFPALPIRPQPIILTNMAKPPFTMIADGKLETVDRLNAEFEKQYSCLFRIENQLTRSLVSFQANKNRAVYRWFKYKEAFSADLVERLLDQYSPDRGVLLDPFAGSGTALFVASALGMRAEGIELLPVGQVVIETRQLIESEMTPEDVLRIKRWSKSKPWSDCGQTHPLNELRITKGAYPDETVKEMGRYLATVEQESPHVRIILRFALLCVLESISYTRKDGQYLRWDHRAGDQPVREPFYGILCYLAALPIVIVFMLMVVLVLQLGPKWITPPTHPIAGEVLHSGWWGWLQILFVASIGAPFVEETMFRGVLYRHLREATAGRGRWRSVVISALAAAFIFAALHPQGLLGILPLMALACGFTAAREWRGSLVPSITVHALHNGMLTLMLILAAG
jgi:membrane protease YdiL (CAAX protease family)